MSDVVRDEAGEVVLVLVLYGRSISKLKSERKAQPSNLFQTSLLFCITFETDSSTRSIEMSIVSQKP